MFGNKAFLRIGKLTDASIAGLQKNSYELTDCNFKFMQGVDENGKPQTDVYSGTIEMTYPNLPANDMLSWAMKSKTSHDGTIVICDMDDKPLEKLYFENAFCVGLYISYNQQGTGYVQTKISLHAEIMRIDNGVQVDNNWTKF